MNTIFRQKPEAFRMFLGQDGIYRPQYHHTGEKWTNFVKNSQFVKSADLNKMEAYLRQYTHTWTCEEEGDK